MTFRYSVPAREKIQDLLCLVRGRRHGRLVRHYFLVSAIVMSAGLILSGLLEISFRHRENWEHFSLIQQEIAAAAAFKIEQFVLEIERGMRRATKSRDLVSKGLSSDYKWELRRLLLNIRSITEAVAFDLNGATRAEASHFRPFFPEGPGPPPSTALQKVREGKTYFGPVSFTRGYGPYLIIAVPIERFAGELIGILQARIDLKYVGETLSSLRVGRAGHVHLVTGSGLLIGHPDLSVVLQKRNLAKLEQTQTVFRSVSDVTTPNTFATRNMHEQRVLTSYALIPSVGWAVVAEQPIEEVYTPLYASLLRTSVVLLIGLGVALMATLFVSRRVVRPLETLRQGVESIGRGNLSVRLDVKTGDELEILADEVNEMTAHLREAYTGLESKVAERTQALTIANERLEEASQHKSQFLAHVNHELRTPMSAIIGYGRLLLRATEGQIAPVQRENLQDLLRNAERLLALIDSLLDFAKIEAGKMEIRLEPVEVGEVVRGAVSTIEPILNGGNVRLVQDIAPDIPLVNSDREKLRQIILNLLDNAAKFTERGEIKIAASHHRGSLKLVVSDTGIGIEHTDLSQIFEKFERGDSWSARKVRGTGLGLAIVKRFVHLLGGDVSAESEVGKGSTFTVVLPCEPRPA